MKNLLESRHSITGKRSFYLILLLCLHVACTSAPIQEMSDARQSIQAARAVAPGNISQQNLQTAEDLLKKAEIALGEGDFSVAKKKARQARAIAMRAQQVAQDYRGIAN